MKRQPAVSPAGIIARIFILIVFFLMVAPVRSVSALSQVFVTPTGAGDCSQGSPCDLATGLSLVDTGGTLYAAAGTYTGKSGNQVVLLTKSINFLGGWDSNTSVPVVRDPETYVSILDGEHARRVITVTWVTLSR